MRAERDIMGMPVRLEIVDETITVAPFEEVFARLRAIDECFSTYKPNSEISRFNRGELSHDELSGDVLEIFDLAEQTALATDGYFSITTPDGMCDPSGIVKGWAIQKVADLLVAQGFANFYVEIAGDIQTLGTNALGLPWGIGIKNPYALQEIVKVVYPRGAGVATSGSYERGTHIYNPHTGEPVESYDSLTIIGPNIFEADRFATAVFAMGGIEGLGWVEAHEGLEAYAIMKDQLAYFTSGFETYTQP
jgi:FAD:protein FMN transferase